MSEKYVPQRKCVGCGKVTDKPDLVRIPQGNRGMYICRDEKCLTLAIKKRRLPQNMREELREVINAKQ